MLLRAQFLVSFVESVSYLVRILEFRLESNPIQRIIVGRIWLLVTVALEFGKCVKLCRIRTNHERKYLTIRLLCQLSSCLG